ncbi:NosD domain-containing protein (plasmid) [Deinococcus radiomollis]|uniref:NosD domain-containing protein n=1 Tax=Deinococcus radiomollis TaxID=468916 RepID=UPI0038916058
MAFTPPAGVTPIDRKPPSAPTYADIPAVLDWLRGYYGGNTVRGLLITDRATGNTYRVDSESTYSPFVQGGPYGTYKLSGVQGQFAGRVRDYGAVANDQSKAAANTTAIAAAILAWEGKTIIFDGDPSGGATTYYVTQGFNVGDFTKIRGEGRVILKIADGTPARTVEMNQTAFFTGKNAYTNLTSAGTYGVSIENLELDMNQPNARNALLGAVKLLGAQGCTVRGLTVTSFIATDQDSCFGIQVSTYANSPDCFGNVVENNTVHMTRDWYTGASTGNPSDTGVTVNGVVTHGAGFVANSQNQINHIGITLSSATGGDGGRNGAHLDDTRNPANGYLASRCYGNTVKGNRIDGGSHGISLTNARENVISDNQTENSAHRGIISTPTCDNNRIERNTCTDHGSTAIHFAYDSRGNIVRGNVVNGVRNLSEGDGIKAYVLCSGNIIEGNTVINAGRQGIRVAHGSNYNIIRGNQVTWTKGPGVAGQQSQTDYQYTTGIMVKGMSQPQYDAGLTAAAMFIAVGNTVEGNTVRGTYKGYELKTDSNNTASAVIGNKLLGNHAAACGTGYFHDTSTDTAVNGNTFVANTAERNTADFVTNLSNAYARVNSCINLPDKGGAAAAAQTVFTTAYDSTQLPSAFPVGVSVSNVNGDATLPQGTQGALETMKLGATFDLEKFIVQLFYPANSGGLIAPWRRYALVRNVGTDPSGWTAWQRLALASEVSTVAPSAAPATPITITPTATGSAGTITSQSFVQGSTSGNKRRYYGSYVYTPASASAFNDHTIAPAAGFTVEVHAPTGIQQSNGLPCPHALMSATSIRANANVGAVQVKFVFDLIG